MVTGQVDNVYVGLYLGERRVEITPQLVGHYSNSVDDHNPRYSADPPFAQPVAPALLLHSEVYRTLSWYLPQIYGNLHARQEWDLFHPIMVGDTVTTRSQVIDRYIRRNREYVVNEVTCFGEDGRMLNRGRTHQSFLLDRGTSGIVVDKEREKAAERRFDIGDGELLEEVSGPPKEVTLEMCKLFSGPNKNYHNDVDEARKLGFPDVVVQGMMPLCFISEMMTARFGEGWFAGGRMNVALVNVIWRGDTVTARGVVREITPEGSRRRVQLQVWCEKRDGTKVVLGTAGAIAE
jgi:acyl dehydratase